MKLKKAIPPAAPAEGGAPASGGAAIADRFKLDVDPAAKKKKAAGTGGVSRNAALAALLATLAVIAIVSAIVALQYQDWDLNRFL